ncbi:MAG: hypothetical protein RBT05_08370 [Bacteroidales bacterium]|nr:hypothetical protein [Bacteroidales bacterium]
MSWNLENLNPGTKFPCPWDDKELEHPDCEWIELVLLTDEENLEIFKQLGIKINKSAKEINPKTRRMEYVQLPLDIKDEDRKRYNEELWDRTIKDWRLIGVGGVDIECTRELKTKFMREAPKFNRWYANSMEKLEGLNSTYKEELEKNS